MSVKYYVLNEHTLGYVDDRQPNQFQVLHGSVLKGGYDWKNGPIVLGVPGKKLRAATLEDFDEYRVLPPPSMREEPTGEQA